jgi:hypothetical protein
MRILLAEDHGQPESGRLMLEGGYREDVAAMVWRWEASTDSVTSGPLEFKCGNEWGSARKDAGT